MGSLLQQSDLFFAQFIIGAEGVADATLPRQVLKPDAGVQVLTATNIAIMVVVTLAVVDGEPCAHILQQITFPGDDPGAAAGDGIQVRFLTDKIGIGLDPGREIQLLLLGGTSL